MSGHASFSVTFVKNGFIINSLTADGEESLDVVATPAKLIKAFRTFAEEQSLVAVPRRKGKDDGDDASDE